MSTGNTTQETKPSCPHTPFVRAIADGLPFRDIERLMLVMRSDRKKQESLEIANVLDHCLVNHPFRALVNDCPQCAEVFLKKVLNRLEGVDYYHSRIMLIRKGDPVSYYRFNLGHDRIARHISGPIITDQAIMIAGVHLLREEEARIGPQKPVWLVIPGSDIGFRRQDLTEQEEESLIPITSSIDWVT